MAVLLVLTAGTAFAAAEEEQHRWSGEWHSFWRDGQAVLTLRQDGNRVTGSYAPYDGQVDGRIEDGVLRGTWQQAGAQGGFLFALSENGSTFTGRFESGEFWNGMRLKEGEDGRRLFTAAFSPRETLRTVMAAANDAAFNNNAAAARFFVPLLYYEDGAANARERSRRREALWHILNFSTFRIYDAPAVPDGDEASFPIGPAGGKEKYDLRFRATGNGNWQIVVDTRERLEAALERMLSDLGYASYSEALVARSHSPREVIRSFLLGMSRWSDGGAEQVLETLDLSYLPPHMRAIEGPILADYLRQVIDRVGYIIWQEVPDDPNMVVPYTFYRHPLGSIRIERMPGDPEEPPRWAFSSATLEAVPDLFAAIQDMPLVEGVGTPEPVTEFFQLREEIREFSPVLLERGVLLENWQWGALLLAVIASLVAGWLAAVLLAGFLALFWRDRDDASREAAYIQLAWPLRIAVASTGLLILLANLGLLHSGLGYGASIVSLIAVIGLTFLVFRLIGLIGGFFIHRAEETPGYVDEIVSSLATGLLKLVTVILGIFGAADVVGLPYEGVITGLGIGGIALAFAARDTVSNMLGGAILMADRPFKRGDLIATEGELATIENVGLRSTRLRTLDDSLLVIPNAQLSDKAIVNWGQRRRRKVLLQIGLTYDTPRESLDKFVERLKEVYRDQPRADLSTYYVGLKGFGPSSIDIELWGYFGVLGYEPYVEALHQLMGDIVELAKEVGVSFAFPTRTIHVASDAPGLMPEIAAAGEGPAGASKAPANIA